MSQNEEPMPNLDQCGTLGLKITVPDQSLLLRANQIGKNWTAHHFLEPLFLVHYQLLPSLLVLIGFGLVKQSRRSFGGHGGATNCLDSGAIVASDPPCPKIHHEVISRLCCVLDNSIGFQGLISYLLPIELKKKLASFWLFFVSLCSSMKIRRNMKHFLFKKNYR